MHHPITKRLALLCLSLALSLPLIAQKRNAPTGDSPAPKVYQNLFAALQEPEQVRRLNLSNQNLEQIPWEVFSLPNLEELNLSNNRLINLPG
ncbi:MAG: leucine-rich repeat domain-containing protein, partial [Bacteroidia bacterium]|nr:leucine-rich repeat domain-containing protein [Bacteroidia bacterium]